MVERASIAGRPFGEEFARTVAENAYKVMAYKDEYEVARLYADPAFRADLDRQFAETRKISVWLAPPLLSPIDPRTCRPAKRKFGPWIFTAFTLLARMKSLRGTWADPFGRTPERRAERELRDDYLATVEHLCRSLNAATIATATRIAALPSDVRGFGPVKEAALERAAIRRAELFAQLEATRDIASRTLAA